MDMRIPLKISAKGMKSHDGTKDNLVSVILVGIFGFIFMLSVEDIVLVFVLVFSILGIIEEAGESISGSDKEIVKKDTMLDEIFSHLPGYSKDNMAMLGFKSHGGNESGTLFGFLGATLSTEVRMAGMSHHGFLAAFRALKEIATKIDSMAEDGFLNIIESDRTKFTNVKEMSQIIIVVEKDISKRSLLFRIVMMREIKKG